MTKKKPSLYKKKPFNRSIRAGLILAFEHQCLLDNVDINDMTEVLIESYLEQRYYDNKDKG